MRCLTEFAFPGWRVKVVVGETKDAPACSAGADYLSSSEPWRSNWVRIWTFNLRKMQFFDRNFIFETGPFRSFILNIWICDRVMSALVRLVNASWGVYLQFTRSKLHASSAVETWPLFCMQTWRWFKLVFQRASFHPTNSSLQSSNLSITTLLRRPKKAASGIIQCCPNSLNAMLISLNVSYKTKPWIESHQFQPSKHILPGSPAQGWYWHQSLSPVSISFRSRGISRLTLIPRSRCTFRTLHPGQSLSYPPEQVLDVVSHLRTRLNKHQVILLCLFLSLLRCDLALVIQIRLVSHEHNYNIISTFASYVVYPFPCVLEGFRICRLLADIHTTRKQRHYLRYHIPLLLH